MSEWMVGVSRLALLLLLIVGRTYNGRLKDIIFHYSSLHHIHTSKLVLKHPFLNTKTEWHYLLAVFSRLSFLSVQAPSALTAHITSNSDTRKPHEHFTTSSSAHPNEELHQLMPTRPNFFPQQAAVRACSDSSVFELHLVLPQNFNYFVPSVFSCVSVVTDVVVLYSTLPYLKTTHKQWAWSAVI